MGVFKNDVGRPSNKTIRTRFILKLIGLILVVGLAFFVGYKLSGEKEEVKENKKQNEVVDNTKKENKYENLQFVNQVSVEATINGTGGYEGLDVKIEEGVVVGYVESTKGKIESRGINEKVKYISGYCRYDYDVCLTTIVALTEKGNLYIGSMDYDYYKIKFEYVASNIKEILLTGMVASFDDASGGGIENKIYALTNEEELLEVKFDESNLKFYLSNDKYEDAYLYVGDYHQGFTAYNSVIRLKDKSFGFYYNQAEKEFVPIKYNGNVVKVKDLFIGYNFDYEDDYENYIYVIDENNNLLTNKERFIGTTIKENSDEYYELKKVSESLVKKYETITYKDEDEITRYMLKVLFEDGTEMNFDYFHSSEDELY